METLDKSKRKPDVSKRKLDVFLGSLGARRRENGVKALTRPTRSATASTISGAREVAPVKALGVDLAVKSRPAA